MTSLTGKDASWSTVILHVIDLTHSSLRIKIFANLLPQQIVLSVNFTDRIVHPWCTLLLFSHDDSNSVCLSEISYYWVFYMEFHWFIIILTVIKTPVTHQIQLFITMLLDRSAKITIYFISTAGGRQLEVWLNNLSLIICPNIPLRTSVVILQESVVALASLSSDFLSEPSLPRT